MRSWVTVRHGRAMGRGLRQLRDASLGPADPDRRAVELSGVTMSTQADPRDERIAELEEENALLRSEVRRLQRAETTQGEVSVANNRSSQRLRSENEEFRRRILLLERQLGRVVGKSPQPAQEAEGDESDGKSP